MEEKKKYEKPKIFKVTSSIPVPVNEQVDHWAAIAGMQKTAFLSILIQLGLQSWLRAYAPEKLLSPEDWAKIAKSASGEKNAEG